MTINTDEPEGALTVAEFCVRYAISRAQFYREISDQRLAARKRGAVTLVSRAEAARWFNALPDFSEAKRAKHAQLLLAGQRSKRPRDLQPA